LCLGVFIDSFSLILQILECHNCFLAVLSNISVTDWLSNKDTTIYLFEIWDSRDIIGEYLSAVGRYALVGKIANIISKDRITLHFQAKQSNRMFIIILIYFYNLRGR
jgi:hypothetical protein